MHGLLVDFLVLLGVSIPISLLFQRLKLPAIIGFLATGIVVGPYGAGLISNLQAVDQFAEIGVVLLLFTIGLEFSVRDLFTGSARIFLIGFAQIVTTIGITLLISRRFSIPTTEAVLAGFLFSLSSTAIVLKLFSDRGELDTPQAKIAISILLLQDLSVIPMMLITGGFATGSIQIAVIAKQLLSALLALMLLFVVSRYVLPALLKQALGTQSREVFLVTILFICLGTAYASSRFGLSLAIGAFIAGMVLAGSAYSHQILSDILPFRDTFNAIFFISVGMLLDVSTVAKFWSTNLALTGAILIGKILILFFLLLMGRYAVRISWMVALTLSQVGEFSFLLARQAKSLQLIPENLYQAFLASSILTMFLTPFLMLIAFPTGLRLQRVFGRLQTGEPETPLELVKDHLVIIGFGLNGRNLARVVKDAGIPFIVIELDDLLIKEGAQQQIPILFGDATQREVLIKAGMRNARMMVVAISDPAATRRCVVVARSLNRDAVILVRTKYVSEVDLLTKQGANVVIPEEFETSIEIFARVLHHYGIPDHLINQQISIVRAESYGMLRGLSVSQERLLKISELFLKSTVQQIVIGGQSPAVGKTLAEVDLRRKTGVTVIAVIRNEEATTNPPADFRLMENDLVILWGAHQELAEAAKLL